MNRYHTINQLDESNISGQTKSRDEAADCSRPLLPAGVGILRTNDQPAGGGKMPNQTNVQLLIPDTMPKSVGYSQVAVVARCTVVFVAGQVALDKSGTVVGKGDFRAQIQQVFENLKAAIEAAGATFDDVVKLNSYFLDISDLPVFRDVRDKYVNLKNPPASTAVQVPRLFRPEFLVEVEAVAAVPEK